MLSICRAFRVSCWLDARVLFTRLVLLVWRVVVLCGWRGFSSVAILVWFV